MRGEPAAKALSLLAAAFLSLACAKGSPPAEPPEQSVEASSGPIHIKLELYRSRARVRLIPGTDHEGKDISYRDADVYYRATLRNIGAEPIAASGAVFFDPRNMERSLGVFLEVRDPSGRLVPPYPYFSPFHRPSIEKTRKLEAGESISSPEWAFVDRAPVRGYTHAPFTLDRPGRYRIRLVYDYTPLRAATKRLGLPPDPAEFRLETEDLWVDIGE